MKNILFLITVFCFLNFTLESSAQNLQGDLGDNTFLNPIFGGDYPDPTIIRDGDNYYITHSAFDYLPGLVVFHSKDMVNWKPISYGLKTYLGSIWAPDICKFDDKFYIYFTVSNSSGFSNFVVWANSPYGPWSDPIDLKVGNIDPCPIAGDDGSKWLFLSDGKRIKLADDGLSTIPETLEKVYSGWEYPKDWVTEGFHLEGPKLKKIGDYYYYLNAQGGTAGPPTSHMVVVARSKSIDGPWENDPNNPLIHTYSSKEKWWSKGHGSLIDTPDGEWWIFYHAYENGYTNLGRQTLLEPVYMTEDAWFEAPLGTKIEDPIRKPIISKKSSDRRDLLNKFRIGLDWKYYKNYDPTRTKVNKDVLTMKAQGTNPPESAPLMFVAGKQSYELSIQIDLTGNATAGLILFYNSKSYIGTGFDKQSIHFWSRGEFKENHSHKGGKRLWLKLRNEKNNITGYFSYDGINWIKENWQDQISDYTHHNLYDFQSVLPGIFVYGDGEAKFSNFKFEDLR